MFEDKVVVVTGGTRGIGFAIVRAFLKEGARVILCGSREETVNRALNKLSDEGDYKVSGIHPRLTNYDEVKSAFDAIIDEYGRIDILVNNAGIADATPFTEYTLEQFKKVMDLNVDGVFNCTRAVVENMIDNGSGVIINTSSMVSKTGQPGGVAYPASKFAVNGLTISLARELAPMGIRVNAVAPGITKTDMLEQAPEEAIAALTKQIPLKRIGEAEDIANAVLFLASDKASYISGVILSVDGLAVS